MRLGIISATLFAIAGIAAAFLSGKILGPGFWGWVMLGGGLFVGISPHVPALTSAGRALGFMAGMLGLLASSLGLLAGFVGGSFRMPGDQKMLLVLIFIMAVTGILYSRSGPRSSNRQTTKPPFSP